LGPLCFCSRALFPYTPDGASPKMVSPFLLKTGCCVSKLAQGVVLGCLFFSGPSFPPSSSINGLLFLLPPLVDEEYRSLFSADRSNGALRSWLRGLPFGDMPMEMSGIRIGYEIAANVFLWSCGAVFLPFPQGLALALCGGLGRPVATYSFAHFASVLTGGLGQAHSRRHPTYRRWRPASLLSVHHFRRRNLNAYFSCRVFLPIRRPFFAEPMFSSS